MQGELSSLYLMANHLGVILNKVGRVVLDFGQSYWVFKDMSSCCFICGYL